MLCDTCPHRYASADPRRKIRACSKLLMRDWVKGLNRTCTIPLESKCSVIADILLEEEHNDVL
jgi:hypothetical protein